MTETTHSRSFVFFFGHLSFKRFNENYIKPLQRDCRIIRVSNDGTDTFPQFQLFSTHLWRVQIATSC
jgi:hypothetical protein